MSLSQRLSLLFQTVDEKNIVAKVMVRISLTLAHIHVRVHARNVRECGCVHVRACMY